MLLTLILDLVGVFCVTTTPNSARFYIATGMLETFSTLIPIVLFSLFWTMDWIGITAAMIIPWASVLGGLQIFVAFLFTLVAGLFELIGIGLISNIIWLVVQIIVFILLILGGGHQAYIFLRRMITVV